MVGRPYFDLKNVYIWVFRHILIAKFVEHECLTTSWVRILLIYEFLPITSDVRARVEVGGGVV